MEWRDQLLTLAHGVACTVCDSAVAPDRVRLLARRDDLAFVQLDCEACGSTTLGFVFRDVLPPESVRFADPTPIGSDDVLDMHELLEAWDGDLAGLLEVRPSPPTEDRASPRGSGRIRRGARARR